MISLMIMVRVEVSTKYRRNKRGNVYICRVLGCLGVVSPRSWPLNWKFEGRIGMVQAEETVRAKAESIEQHGILMKF